MKNLTVILCLTIAVLLGSGSTSFALPSCPSEQAKRYHNCFGTKFYKGRKYVGEWKNDKRHGQGTMTFTKSGNKYVGEWKDGKGHGQGTYTQVKSGNKYVGGFKNSKYHGQGTNTFGKTGNKYVGEFRDGKRHGQGTFTFATGSKYVGQYRGGEYHGQGTYSFPDGTTYIGEFRDGKRHGQGTFTLAKGGKYVGQFRDNKFNGQGTFTFASGKIQKGMFENGSFVGKGFAHAKTIDSIDISKFKPGKEYKNYPDSSCKSRNKTVCINKIDYKYLCKNAKSITTNVRNTSSVLYSGDMARFIRSNGSISGIRIKFQDPKYCSVSFSISGIVNGSSRRKTITGRGTTFIVTKKGEILIHYVSTM